MSDFDRDDSLLSVRDKLRNHLIDNAEVSVATKGMRYKPSDAASFSDEATVAADGSTVYLQGRSTYDKKYADLYSLGVAPEVFGSVELYDVDVSTTTDVVITDDNRVVYFKEYKNGAGDLYIDKKVVDGDVSADPYGDMALQYNQGSLVYITDYYDEDENDRGTLNIYDGDKSIKIADDVRQFRLLPDGRVVYLRDYSTYSHTGELYIWENGESRQIADDVNALFISEPNSYQDQWNLYNGVVM